MSLLKTHCRKCRTATNHTVLAEHRTSGNEADGSYWWNENFQIVRCCGCDGVAFRVVSYGAGDFNPQTEEYLETEKLYPDPIAGRSPMDGCQSFPSKTYRVYLETLKALNNGMPLLAAIGLRALIESLCLQQGTAGKNLEERIDQLAADGLLSHKQAEFLHNHRFMGNIAAHEMEAPRTEHLVAAIDIAETLLKTIYVLPMIASQIKPSKHRS